MVTHDKLYGTKHQCLRVPHSLPLTTEEQAMSIKIAALALAGSLTVMTTGASAAIVCNDEETAGV